MDGARFDRLARTLRSRRAAIGGLLGGLTALIGLGAEEGHAHNLVPACQKLKDARRRAACLSRARRHRRNQHSCKPKPPATFCANRCGTTQNNCKKPVRCTCPAGKSCLANKGCNRSCSFSPSIPCPTGCVCGIPLADGPPPPTTILCYAGPTITTCTQIPTSCVTSANCPRGSFCGAVSGSCVTNRCVPNCLS